MDNAPRLFDDPSFFQGDGKPRRRGSSRRQQFGKPINPVVLQGLWDFYVETFHSGRGVKPRLTDDRAALITMAVNQYGAAVVRQAFRGCSLSGWHMGQNPLGKRYVGVELILRDEAHIERFAGYAEGSDTKGGFLDD
jgi:hypothetical protein